MGAVSVSLGVGGFGAAKTSGETWLRSTYSQHHHKQFPWCVGPPQYTYSSEALPKLRAFGFAPSSVGQNRDLFAAVFCILQNFFFFFACIPPAFITFLHNGGVFTELLFHNQ